MSMAIINDDDFVGFTPCNVNSRRNYTVLKCILQLHKDEEEVIVLDVCLM